MEAESVSALKSVPPVYEEAVDEEAVEAGAVDEVVALPCPLDCRRCV